MSTGVRTEYTAEQRAIIAHVPRARQRILINAYAGSGKTTTCRGIIERHGAVANFHGVVRAREAGGAGARFLYIVFNRTTQQDAERKLGHLHESCECRTAHSLALAFTRARAPKFRLNTQPYQIANTEAQRILLAFFLSDETHIEPKTPSHATALELWDRICRGTLGFTHDAYLKYFATHADAPQWIAEQYGAVIVDEAQDISEVLMRFLVELPLPVYFVGDEHQSIYGFRNTRNALASVPELMRNPRKRKHDELREQSEEEQGAACDELVRFALTQSFRFGESIADVANTLLHHFRLDASRVRGTDAPGELVPAHALSQEQLFEQVGAEPWTAIGRTNAGVFLIASQAAQRGVRIHFVCRDPRSQPVLDAIRYALRRYAPRGVLARGRVKQALDEAKRNNDAEQVTVLGLLQRHGARDLENMLRVVSSANVAKVERAQLVIGTVHGNKGLEWPRVFLLEEFAPLGDLVYRMAECRKLGARARLEALIEEVHLYYVAATRAQTTLRLNSHLTDLMRSYAE